MLSSFRSSIAHIFGWFSFCTAIWSTITLFVLIEKKSKKEFGGYKIFLRIYCIYAFLFAMIDWLVQPAAVVDIYGFGYVFYSENRLFDLGYSVTHAVQVLYCGCFIASSSFLSLNFIYRYVSTCHKNLLNYFRGWYLLIWFLYCFLPFSVWSYLVYTLMSPTPEKTRHLNISTIQVEGFDISDRPYVAPICRHVMEPNYGDIEWHSMSALFGLSGFQILFYGISLICGMLTYRANLELFKAAQLSTRLYRIQMQLLKAIIVQAAVPLISVYIPPAIVIVGCISGTYVGDMGFFVVISISLYPPLDSLLFLLTIRDYRDAVFCKSVIGNQDSGSNSVHPRPNTAKVSVVSHRVVQT